MEHAEDLIKIMNLLLYELYFVQAVCSTKFHLPGESQIKFHVIFKTSKSLYKNQMHIPPALCRK